MPSRERVLTAVWKAATAANVWVYRRSSGRIGGRGRNGMPVLLLTTTGRRSGQQRTRPLGYVEHDGGYLVCGAAGGSDRDPAWAHNLRATPRPTVEVGERRFVATARELLGEEYEPAWRQVRDRYAVFADYQSKTTRRLPVFRLAPDPADSPA